MPVILTSNGLTSEAILQSFVDLQRSGFRKAAVVVTADAQERENNRKAIDTKDKLQHIGYLSTFCDIEFSPAEALAEYDIVHFMGGNPFHLLNQIRRTHANALLHKLLADGRAISGASAGSLVLGQTIALISEFDPDLNDSIGLVDLDGVGLTSTNVCPHYSKYSTRYERFEERICLVEKLHRIQITRLNDGEAIIVANGQTNRI